VRRKLIAASIAALTLSAGSLAISFNASAGPSDPVTLGAPAYFSDAASWTRLLATPGLSHIVVNAYDATTVSAINGYVSQANAAGIRTLGYTGAGFAPAGSPNSGAAKSLATLQSDVGTIFSAYPNLGGIFLDEIQNTTPCDPTWVQFYRGVSSWFRSTYPGKTLAFNPGAPLCADFNGLADIYVMAERSAAAYNSALSYYNDPQFNWIRNLPNNQVWGINYAVPAGSVATQINDMSTTLGAGVVWVTSGATTNDYALLPATDYLCVMSQRAVNTCTPGVTIATTTSTLATTTTTSATTTTSTTTTIPTAAIVVAAVTTTAAPTTTTAAPTATTTITAPPTTAAPATVAPVVTNAPVGPTLPPAPTTTLPVLTAASPAFADPAAALVGAPAFTG
jgi:Spherulation-specific family 4